TKTRLFFTLSYPGFLERHIIVVVEVIKPDDLISSSQQPFRKVKPNEPRHSSDQHAHERLPSFDERMAVPETLVAFGPSLFQSGPSSLQPVAAYRPPPLAAKVRQVLGRIRFGFGALDGVLCDHPEVMDEGRSRHPSGDLGPLCPPEEVRTIASRVTEPFIKL